jgi:hypothetical protein
MRIPLDDKQTRLVRAWMSYGAQDDYGRFISLWVAFNALCYARYEKEAYQPRADLDRKKSSALADITAEGLEVTGTLSRQSDRVRLEVRQPSLLIRIGERYTEDIIFDRFARDFQPEYEAWLTETEFGSAVDSFREAISRHGHHYIVNMTKAEQHLPDEVPYAKMKAARVIVPWEDRNKLAQLKDVLYQVRNNVFHGEKVPGDLNDNRIVKAAAPVLRVICERAGPAPYEGSGLV